ncbi:MAG: hypothetical protein IJ842_05040 [Bacilli bacterium]|nr:hypothetical protein [Bacilli bacterium]
MKKMNSLLLASMLGGMGVFGFMYLKKHPNVMCMMKDMAMEANKSMYNKLDNTDF